MLILTRKAGEKIMIGDQVVCTVLSIKSHQVKIGIDAPAETAVHRQEIYERIQLERRTDSASKV